MIPSSTVAPSTEPSGARSSRASTRSLAAGTPPPQDHRQLPSRGREGPAGRPPGTAPAVTTQQCRDCREPTRAQATLGRPTPPTPPSSRPTAPRRYSWPPAAPGADRGARRAHPAPMTHKITVRRSPKGTGTSRNRWVQTRHGKRTDGRSPGATDSLDGLGSLGTGPVWHLQQGRDDIRAFPRPERRWRSAESARRGRR